MKRVFSSLLMVFSVPVRLIKKVPKDNFALGLVFGAVFSLLVNVITVQIQEEINKQRILEAIENEILANTLQAKNISDTNLKNIDNKSNANMFHAFVPYSNDLWTQSSEPIQYIAQLDPESQIAIFGYYGIILKNINILLEKFEQISRDKLSNCYENVDVNSELKIECDYWNKFLLNGESDIALKVTDEGLSVLKVFHPTQDRLNNWLLRLLMGNRSTRVLSGK